MKRYMLYGMAALYVAAGINHFVHPFTYLQIMPPWLPHPAALVAISGICEIIPGVLLLPARTRPVAAWLIIALLFAVFPANVQMAVNWRQSHHPYLWIAVVRLPLQAALIWWAWIYTRRDLRRK